MLLIFSKNHLVFLHFLFQEIFNSKSSFSDISDKTSLISTIFSIILSLFFKKFSINFLNFSDLFIFNKISSLSSLIFSESSDTVISFIFSEIFLSF